MHWRRPATWWCCGAELGARQEQTSKAERNVGLKGFMQILKAPGAPERERSLAFWQVPSGTWGRVKAQVSCRTPKVTVVVKSRWEVLACGTGHLCTLGDFRGIWDDHLGGLVE